jgi:DNA-binding SARP family transcriptional activator/TolB-like protein
MNGWQALLARSFDAPYPREPRSTFFQTALVLESTSGKSDQVAATSRASSPFALHVLGGARIEVGGSPLSGKAAHRRRLALMALLAASPGGALSRERILGYLWPDHEPENARRLLSEAVYVIRKELGESSILSVGDEVHLRPEVVWSDVRAFRSAQQAGALDEAVALYRGPFLDGWYVSDAPEFERWAETQRERLAHEYVGALRTLAERDEAAGFWRVAVSRWQQLVRTEPYVSRHALRLAQALASTGERAQARQVLRAHELRLKNELDVTPDADFRAFADSLAREPARPAGTTASESPGDVRETAATLAATERAVPVDDLALGSSPPVPAMIPEAGGSSAITHFLRSPAGIVGAALAVLVLLGSVAWYAMRSREDPPLSADERRIAVLYFEDHSPDHRYGTIAGELTTALIDELSSVGAFHVVSQNGVRPFRGQELSLDSIARRLGVGTVVEGSIQGDEGQLRVSTQITDVTTHTVLASRRIAGPSASLFSLERQLTREVARVLRVRMGQQTRLREDRSATDNEIARKLVVLAERERDDAISLADHPEPDDVAAAIRALARADSLFARAHEEDARWTRPLLGRGWTARDLARLRNDSASARILRSALPFAEQALAREPANPDALELRGTLTWGIVSSQPNAASDSVNLLRAERDLRDAVRIDSTRATAWGTLSYLLSLRGSFAESQLAARRALQEDAYLSGARDIQFELYASSVMLGDLRSARTACLDGQREYPDDTRFLECELTLLRNDIDAPADPARAWALVDKLDVVDPAPKAIASGRPFAPIFRRIVAAAVSARAGDRAVARREIVRTRQMAGRDSILLLDLAYGEAYVRLLLGEREQAVALLRELIAKRPVVRARVLRDRLLRPISAQLSTPPTR